MEAAGERKCSTKYTLTAQNSKQRDLKTSLTGSLKPENLQSQTTKFKPTDALTGLGAYNVRVRGLELYGNGVYKLVFSSLWPIPLNLKLHSLDWECTVWNSTSWVSLVSG